MIPELTPLAPPDPEARRRSQATLDAANIDGESNPVANRTDGYLLDEQIGYLLRLANQRHLELFSEAMPSLTPTQFSILVRLDREEDISQNELGRRIGIDAATTKGVIDRLSRKKLVKTSIDANDKRRLRISLTQAGESALADAIPIAREITSSTLCQLDSQEAVQLIQLLKKLQKT